MTGFFARAELSSSPLVSFFHHQAYGIFVREETKKNCERDLEKKGTETKRH
jgi:hypothetical protein|tara:strand:- start:122 stop:274 length:153 start_codon:yes stop_codon:yes gene_type:complete